MKSRNLALPLSEHGRVALALFMLILLAAVAYASRPLTPIDETRYIGVAWEMWLRGDFLVPFKNGAPYSHKPPLMIWLYQAGWAIFGVNEWWPRLVHPLMAAGSLLLTFSLARRLWPERADIGGSAVLILVSSLLWTIFSTSAMFDIILAFFTLIGMHGVLMAAEGRVKQGFFVLGVAIGLGVLTKGPVILLHVLPAALLAPWWNRQQRCSHWFAGILIAVLIGAVIALAWALPAGLAGGKAYQHAIFWGQTADRMVESFAHRRPLWWYLPILPALLFPWLVWPGLWSALGKFVRQDFDRGGRFCLAWLAPVVIAFSFISGKQPHYLIPVFPAFALLASRALASAPRIRGLWLPTLVVLVIGGVLLAMATGVTSHAGLANRPLIGPSMLMVAMAAGCYLYGRRVTRPVLAMAMLGIVTSTLGQLTLVRPLYPAYDVGPLARAIQAAQAGGHTVAHLGDYHDQYHFAGRLQAPLPVFDDGEKLKVWLIRHPDAYVVLYPKEILRLEAIPVIASQRYMDGAVALLDAQSALSFLSLEPTRTSRQYR